MSERDVGRAVPWPGLAPNPSTAQARVLLDELARCGVRHVVVCPGSRSTALAIAADEHPELLAHVALDERGAGYLAVGVGRASGQPAAVVVTSGTAVANLLPAVVEADHDSVPLLLLTADRPPELHGVGANQTIEQHEIFGRSVRFVVDLGVADVGLGELVPVGGVMGQDDDRGGADGPAAAVARWRWTACRAHGAAVGRPVEVPQVVSLDGWLAPGPVQVDVPFREPTVPASDDGRTSAAVFPAPLDGRADGAPWGDSDAEPHVPPDHVLDELLAQLRGHERGLVVVGGGVPGGPGRVAALASTLGWPVVAEPHVAIDAAGVDRPDADADGAPSDDGALSDGVAGDVVLRHGTLLLGADGFLDEHAPSVVLRVGRTTVARETTSLLAAVPSVVVVDAHGGWVDVDDARVTLVRGAPAPTIPALLRRVTADPPPADEEWLAGWLAADRRVAAVVDRELAAATGPSEPGVARAVLAAVPPGGRLLVGSSMPIRDVDLVAGRRDDVEVHANRGASGIDGTVATAFGLRLGGGDPTVALVGDLTLLHDQTAWLLREDPAGPVAHLVVVVVDNDGGGIFSFLPQRRHVPQFERLFGTPHGVDLADLARLHGLVHHGPDELVDAAAVGDVVAAAAAAGGRHLVHVRSDREANVALHRRLRGAVDDALRDASPRRPPLSP